MLDVIREQRYGERYVYALPSYHATTIQLLTREFYEMLGHATAPLAPAAHKAVYKKIAEHLQVARLPHVKPIIEAYLEKCVESGAEDPEYITRRALYRMKITEAYDTRTEIGQAMRQHEFVIEHMQSSDDPPEEAPISAPPSAPPRLERHIATEHHMLDEVIDSFARNLIHQFNQIDINSSAVDPAEMPPPRPHVVIPPLDISAIIHEPDDDESSPDTPPRRRRSRYDDSPRSRYR